MGGRVSKHTAARRLCGSARRAAARRGGGACVVAPTMRAVPLYLEPRAVPATQPTPCVWAAKNAPAADLQLLGRGHLGALPAKGLHEQLVAGTGHKGGGRGVVGVARGRQACKSIRGDYSPRSHAAMAGRSSASCAALQPTGASETPAWGQRSRGAGGQAEQFPCRHPPQHAHAWRSRRGWARRPACAPSMLPALLTRLCQLAQALLPPVPSVDAAVVEHQDAHRQVVPAARR